MGWMKIGCKLATLSALGLASCSIGSEPRQDENTSSSSAALSASIGFCYHGMSTSLKAVDPFAPRCTLADVPEMLSFVCESSPFVCQFLQAELNGHGTLQCTPYATAAGTTWCVDVVDRYTDGTGLDAPNWGPTRNYFVAYADDTSAPPSPERIHWDEALGTPWCIDPPTELSVAGYVTAQGGFVKPWDPPPPDGMRFERLFKFDPRDCVGCGQYNGPNLDLIIHPDWLSWWYPGFDPYDCYFEVDPGWYRGLSQDRCDREAMYRATRR